MTRNQKKIYKRKMQLQKFFGIIMILISVALVAYVLNTNDPDITAALITTPIGLYLTFSKKCLLY